MGRPLGSRLMLTTLRVRDLATIAEVSLDLVAGLNVLTGETGAGKSILLDAIALLMGDRADRAAIRPGASRLVVEGTFEGSDPALASRLEDAGLDADDLLVIRREVNRDGRSRAWVNGSPTTVATLRALAPCLVDLHGQHQSLELLERTTQRELLDGFAGTTAELAEVAQAHAQLEAVRADADQLRNRRDEALRRADWLRHVVAEITAARLVIGEDESIARELTRLSHAGAIGEAATTLADLLDDERAGVRGQLARAARLIDQLARLDPELQSLQSILDSAWASIDELSRSVAGYRDQVSDDPARLDSLERRRELVHGLLRKHGSSIAEVLEVGRSAAAELDLIDSAVHDLATLERNVAAATDRLHAAAEALTSSRQSGAERLGGEVSRMLPGLGLQGARMEVMLRPLDAPGAHGAEQPEFLASLNAGMAARNIAAAASGGELSRLMLALKVALARQDTAATLIFDEIDQGVGGETAVRIAAALAELATRHQVLVITHQPQIAARADRHLVVAKSDRGGLATSDVSVIHGEDRVGEIARMLGRPDDADARRLAAGMLKL